MSHDEHTPFRENIPAYALGALDAQDAAALESHLQTCASCRTELAGYRTVGAHLLTELPPQAPPAALRQRLQARLPGAHKSTRPRRLNWSVGRVAMGVTFALLLALNVYSVLQVRALQLQQAQLTGQIQTSQTVLAMLSYPNTQNLPIHADNNVTGTLLLDADRNVASLIVWNMPQLPEDQTYQIWLIDPQDGRTSAGIFRPELGQSFTTASIMSAGKLSDFVGIGVTVEPAGGSDHPTGPRIFKVDF